MPQSVKMATPGFWIDCEILENETYDFCLFTVDKSIIDRNEVPFPKPGEILLMVDNILPTLRKELKKLTFKIKGILVYQHDLKSQQQE